MNCASDGLIKSTKTITYDIPAIIALQEDYRETIECILDEMPYINWNSNIETKDYFKSHYNISLSTVKISELQSVKNTCEIVITGELVYNKIVNAEDAYELLSGLIELKKLQSVCRNYLQNILKHADEQGNYPLRFYNGEWVMQNRQPLSYLDEIKQCIIAQQKEI